MRVLLALLAGAAVLHFSLTPSPAAMHAPLHTSPHHTISHHITSRHRVHMSGSASPASPFIPVHRSLNAKRPAADDEAANSSDGDADSAGTGTIGVTGARSLASGAMDDDKPQSPTKMMKRMSFSDRHWESLAAGGKGACGGVGVGRGGSGSGGGGGGGGDDSSGLSINGLMISQTKRPPPTPPSVTHPSIGKLAAPVKPNLGTGSSARDTIFGSPTQTSVMLGRAMKRCRIGAPQVGGPAGDGGDGAAEADASAGGCGNGDICSGSGGDDDGAGEGGGGGDSGGYVVFGGAGNDGGVGGLFSLGGAGGGKGVSSSAGHHKPNRKVPSTA